jgi:hypothetical protein
MSAKVVVTISYPAEGSGVSGGETFAVFGYVSPAVGAQLTARMEYEDSHGKIGALYGTAVPSPPFPFDWTFLFTSVPIVPIKLIVEAVDAYGNTGRAVSHFARRPLRRHPDMAQPPDVQIAFGCGGNPPTFFAGGYCTSPLQIVSKAATLTDANGNTYNGALIDPAPFDYDWYFQFTNVDPGNYTLTVTCTDSQQQSGSASCAVAVTVPTSNGISVGNVANSKR